MVLEPDDIQLPAYIFKSAVEEEVVPEKVFHRQPAPPGAGLRREQAKDQFDKKHGIVTRIPYPPKFPDACFYASGDLPVDPEKLPWVTDFTTKDVNIHQGSYTYKVRAHHTSGLTGEHDPRIQNGSG